MSVDARIREGLTMIDNQLPTVDTVEGYEKLSRDIRRDGRRRAVIAGAAAAVLVAATGAVVLSRADDGKVEPAPTPRTPARVMYLDADGALSSLAHDGSRRRLAVKHVDRFTLSPDGRQLAYVTADSAGARRLWFAKVDGTGAHRVAAPCTGCQPGYGVAWSHDGTRLAYSVFMPGDAPAQLRIRTISTGDEQVVTLPLGTDARGLRFSPDDRLLALNVSTDGGNYVAWLDPARAGSPDTRLTPAYHQVQLPSWSADGRTIYFTATTGGDGTQDTSATIDLFSVGIDGSDLRQLTHAKPGERYFAVVPYAGRFLVSRAEGSSPWQLGWLSADGTRFTPLKDRDGKPVLGSAAQLQP